MSAPNFPHANSSTPVFTPAFAAYEDVDEQLDFGLSLDSPTEFVFSNDIAEADEMHDFEDDDKDAYMRSVPIQRDTSAYGFEPMMPRSFEGFVETNVFEANGKAPVFVLDKVLPSPLNNESTSFNFCLPTVTKSKCVPASPLSPTSYASNIEVPEKERCEFYSVNPAFTSFETPTKIMDAVKAALSSLRCEFNTTASSQWTLNVNCLLVAEEICFSINLFQLRGASTKYEVEFVRLSGDELVFADLAEHIRSLCSDIDEEGALALFSQTLDAWMDDKQQLTGRCFAIAETEALSLLDEINCEYLHTDALYQVARNIKNHCRHKGNRKLFVQQSEPHKNLLKGLQWMLSDSNELARFALFVLLQYAGDEELYSTFFSTPFERSSVALLLDALEAREKKAQGTKFTVEMVDAVRQSALFA